MRNFRINWMLTLFLVFVLFNGLTFSLRNLVLSGGGVARSGSRVTLRCSYDLEGADLYSIRWYKNEEEFFRFVLKEIPQSMVFTVAGVHVDLSASNDQDVTITDVQRTSEGDYSCEVSADAPLFHTEIESAYLEIVDLPELPPLLDVDRTRYSPGDRIKANCTSTASYPGANITWFINGQVVNRTSTVSIPAYENSDFNISFNLIEIITEEEEKYPKYQVGGSQQETFSGQLKIPNTFPETSEFTAYYENQNHNAHRPNNNIEQMRSQEVKEWNAEKSGKYEERQSSGRVVSYSPSPASMVPLKATRIRLQPSYVGNIKLKCVASIYYVYKEYSVEKEIREESPHIAHVMGQNKAGISHSWSGIWVLLQNFSFLTAMFFNTWMNSMLEKLSISIR